jgi:integrase
MTKSKGTLKKTPKQDIYNTQENFKLIYKQLENKKLFKHKENNEIIKIYIDAKIRGNYKQIIYDVNKPESTCTSNLQKYKILEEFFDKPFTELTQEDINQLQDALNRNLIKTKPTKYKDAEPIKRSYKKDLIAHINQFWKFYRLYSETEKNTILKDITEYLRLRKERPDEDFEYITIKELIELAKHTKNQQQKTLLYFAFDTGSRPIELLSVKRKHFSFDEKENIWTCKLPDMKGTSHDKIRIELLLSSEHINKYFKENDFEPDNYIFEYTYHYTRKFLRELGNKIGKKLTPKVFRKSSTMYLIEQNAPEQYIKAHQGWIQDTRVFKHYSKQSALKTPTTLKTGIKKDAYFDYEEQQTLMKAELEKLKNQINALSEFKEEYKQELLSQKERDTRDKITLELAEKFFKFSKNTKK